MSPDGGGGTPFSPDWEGGYPHQVRTGGKGRGTPFTPNPGVPPSSSLVQRNRTTVAFFRHTLDAIVRTVVCPWLQGCVNRTVVTLTFHTSLFLPCLVSLQESPDWQDFHYNSGSFAKNLLMLKLQLNHRLHILFAFETKIHVLKGKLIWSKLAQTSHLDMLFIISQNLATFGTAVLFPV